ncbi:hypothetical protein MN608_01577 [Microdochium nivale]|nr:hypothetical protein MN608_01577 [Microdochium nivale]
MLLEFPHFKKTPARTRDLILRCTRGAPETSDTYRHIRHENGLIVPGDRHTDQIGPISPVAAVEEAQDIWRGRIAAMQEYIEARVRWQQKPTSSDEKLLGFPQRPSLQAIESALRKEQQRLAARHTDDE